jgi:hypothetical protein
MLCQIKARDKQNYPGKYETIESTAAFSVPANGSLFRLLKY